MIRSFFVAAAIAGLMSGPAWSQPAHPVYQNLGLGGYDLPFLDGGTYRGDVQSPGEFLGYAVGARPASHDEIIRYCRYLAANNDNVTLTTYAHTYEGRELIYMVVSSPENMAQLDELRSDLAKLADPRKLSNDSEADDIIARAPAVAWMAYGIHGDELSSCDAAIQLAYQLVAGTDEMTQRIMNNTIVCIDPLQNADGRTRWLGQLQNFNGAMPDRDTQSMAHSGLWPWGRTNHYFFDLNRDWFATVHPETRGKTQAILEWMPHYLLDCHEMGATNTYLFSPPREPFNPYMVDYIHKWWRKCAEDQGAMFDRYGWAYYTREWNEEFFPGYGSSWAIYLGAVGMLFEQAGVDGTQVMRPEGTVMTYRETVHHQFTGSWANLWTVANGREELLRDFYRIKRDNIRARGGAFVFVPDGNQTRLNRLAAKLSHQTIELEVTERDMTLSRALSTRGGQARNVRVPAGAVIVRTNQPLKQLIQAILTFDIPIESKFLKTERKEVLKNQASRLYDTTGWSLSHAYDVDGYFVDRLPGVRTRAYQPSPLDETPPVNAVTESSVGYAFDLSDDRAYPLLAELLSSGFKLRSARNPFEVGGTVFPRGSIQLRVSDNPGLSRNAIAGIAGKHGVNLHAIPTTLGDRHADLGGAEFALLEAPKVAVLAGPMVSGYSAGAVWHMLDQRLRMRASLLDLSSVASRDLRKYNVIVMPNSWGGANDYKNRLGKRGTNNLREWVNSGGTLITLAAASVFAADTSTGLASTRLKRQVLNDLDSYDAFLDMLTEAEDATVDSLALWQGQPFDHLIEDRDKASLDLVKARDDMARRLFPRGAILNVELDADHWLAYGCGSSTPVLFSGRYAFMARRGTQVAGRLAPRNNLRLAGLMWPEAQERWEHSAYLAREAHGDGQIILFASEPNFRGYFLGGERMLMNAVLLGPGFGADQPVPW